MVSTGSDHFSRLQADALNIFTQSETTIAKSAPSPPGISRPRLIAIHPKQVVERSRLQTRRPFDPENDPEDMRFAQSIQKYGVTQPVMVYRTEQQGNDEICFGLITGHRRVDAALFTDTTSIPALLVPSNTSQESQDLLNALENLQRRDLLPLEKAELIQELMRTYEYKQKDVAEAVGLSESQVSSLLYLLEAPADIQDAVRSGLIGVRNARAIERISEDERQRVYQLAREGMPVNAAVDEIAGEFQVGQEAVKSFSLQTGQELTPEDGTKSRPVQNPVVNPIHSTADASHPIRFLLGDKTTRFLQITRNHRHLRNLTDSSRLLLAVIWLDNDQDIEGAIALMQNLSRTERREFEKALAAIQRLSVLQAHGRRSTALASARRYLETVVQSFLE